ncbi:hypothetical protein DAPPUDRAFT_105717 [Daphnia pulex]|uniref:Uncharacterized protein n=1 Tax=Daphnia pulex TaxID=6669 RepID=E9GRK5_DAPPU|nr:hypothetical protein DAPPUDRAFT_105717 [Daphnia pulex]|eukprot:EFX77899.1 hypothetical protein DAPPUDRAFT_105717 [Daphnia pulex]
MGTSKVVILDEHLRAEKIKESARASSFMTNNNSPDDRVDRMVKPKTAIVKIGSATKTAECRDLVSPTHERWKRRPPAKEKKMLHRCEFLRQWHAATGFFYFIEIAVEEEKMKNNKIATRMIIVNYRKFW